MMSEKEVYISCGDVSFLYTNTIYILYVRYLGNILRSETVHYDLESRARLATLQNFLI